MKRFISYKDTNKLEDRQAAFKKQKEKQTDMVAVIVERSEICTLPDLVQTKYIITSKLKVGLFRQSLQKRLILDGVDCVINLFSQNSLLNEDQTIGQVYQKDQDIEDGYLYLTFQGKNDSDQKQIIGLRENLVLNEGEQLDENLICVICEELAVDPSECEECQNLFCNYCIVKWFQHSKTCPFQCPSSPAKLKSAKLSVRDALQKLNFKCLNLSNGCPSVINLLELDSHIVHCGFQIISCEYKGCEYIGRRNSINKHLNQCKYVVKSCLNCGQNSNAIKQQQEKHEKDKQQINSLSQQVLQAELQLNQFKDDQQQLNQNNLQQISSQKELIKKQFIEISKLEPHIHENSINQSTTGETYKCPNNHSLSWTKGMYGSCVECGKNDQILRYACFECEILFCQTCKPPLDPKMSCLSNIAIDNVEQVLYANLLNRLLRAIYVRCVVDRTDQTE